MSKAFSAYAQISTYSKRHGEVLGCQGRLVLECVRWVATVMGTAADIHEGKRQDRKYILSSGEEAS